MNSNPVSPDDAVLRLHDVRRITGLSRSSIYEMQALRQFPHSIKLSSRAVGWLHSEVRDWLQARALLRSRTTPDRHSLTDDVRA